MICSLTFNCSTHFVDWMSRANNPLTLSSKGHESANSVNRLQNIYRCIIFHSLISSMDVFKFVFGIHINTKASVRHPLTTRCNQIMTSAADVLHDAVLPALCRQALLWQSLARVSCCENAFLTHNFFPGNAFVNNSCWKCPDKTGCAFSWKSLLAVMYKDAPFSDFCKALTFWLWLIFQGLAALMSGWILPSFENN